MSKLFGTDGIRTTYGKYPLTKDFIFKLGKAVGYILSRNGSRSTFLIGKDTRPSGNEIENLLVKGVSNYPVKVYLAGVIPTATLSFLVRKYNLDLSAMISASHNLYQDNGIKFFSSNGLKISDNFEEEIERLVQLKNTETNNSRVADIIRHKKIQFSTDYVDFAKSTIEGLNLKGIKIVIDSAHGAVSNIADRIFEELGAEVTTLNNDSDGKKINLNCGSQYPLIIKDIVLANKAHIGFSFDGDGDRVILTDEKGNILDGDFIMAMLGIYLSKKNRLNKNALVATVMSNIGLYQALKKNNIRLIRTRVGDKYVVQKMLDEGLNLGGEQSGHIIFFDYSKTGDGIITSLQILKLMKTKNEYLSVLSKCMKKYPQVLLNVKVEEKKNFVEMPELKNLINKFEERLEDSGRILLRYSGTEPLARIMIEGKNYEMIKKMAHSLAKVIKKNIGVRS